MRFSGGSLLSTNYFFISNVIRFRFAARAGLIEHQVTLFNRLRFGSDWRWDMVVPGANTVAEWMTLYYTAELWLRHVRCMGALFQGLSYLLGLIEKRSLWNSHWIPRTWMSSHKQFPTRRPHQFTTVDMLWQFEKSTSSTKIIHP